MSIACSCSAVGGAEPMKFTVTFGLLFCCDGGDGGFQRGGHAVRGARVLAGCPLAEPGQRSDVAAAREAGDLAAEVVDCPGVNHAGGNDDFAGHRGDEYRVAAGSSAR